MAHRCSVREAGCIGMVEAKEWDIPPGRSSAESLTVKPFAAAWHVSCSKRHP